MKTLQRPLARYGLAVAALVVATVLRWVLDPYLGQGVTFSTYFAAVAIVGLYAGVGPAVFTLLVGGLLAESLFLSSRDQMAFGPPELWASILLFYLAAALIVLLVLRLRASMLSVGESRREIEDREDLLRRITDAAPMLFAYLDRNLRYRYVSAGYAQWFGEPVEAICGRPVQTLVGEAAYRFIEPQLQRALAGETVEFERDVPLAKAGTRFLRVRFFPVRRGGQIEGVSAVIVDLSERRRLDERDAHLAAIVTTAQEAIITKDLDGKVTSWNPGAERVYGYTAEEMVGASIECLTAPGRQSETAWISDEARAGRAIDGYETVRRHKDGRLIDILLSAAPIRDPEGRVTAVAAIERDITERKQAEAALRVSEARLQAIIDNSPVVLFIKDLQGRYILANRSYLELFKTTADELLGLTDRERALPAEAVAQMQANDRKVIESGEPHDFEESAEIDGESRTYVSTKFPLRDAQGNIYAVCGISTDITDQKRQQEALRENDRRKDQFLSMLAHELRNPLAPIANAVQVLRMEGVEPGGRVAWAAGVIERQAAHLTHLVDDLLDIARINRGRIQLRRAPVEVGAVLRRSADHARPRFEARGVTLEVALPQEALVVDADEGRLVQVVDNLLDNAAKYTERGGTVHLSLERDADRLNIRVRDSGIGIEPSYLPRIFDLFEQADASLDRSGGGLGLGLNLVKRLVEMHGGSVAAHSDGLGQGSEFVLSLPLAKLERPPAACSAALPVAAPRRVLLIEDNADVAQSMEMLLATLGHEVRIASTGHDGIAQAQAFRPHVVLTDLGLPDISGFEVARALRAALGSGARLVAVSGYGQEEYRARSKEAGFDEHLVKPPTLEALTRTLAAAPEGHPGEPDQRASGDSS
ncbi:PAS domain-containing protein [Ectothiorhodospiraceae bacterium 2226]|nr:PAS domain-containing protein [Ectothiorhodospiraceae bacterium 2226]